LLDRYTVIIEEQTAGDEVGAAQEQAP